MLVVLQDSRTEDDQSSFVMSLQNRGVVLTRPEKKKYVVIPFQVICNPHTKTHNTYHTNYQ